ncbi:Late embryogenesis abundant protein [Melia azedarach]|uniref:Late embryogenesis abundant protein n=1 Tax=Melia azedarach TaxID=155640 RepID=A0ACC1Y3N3_MELAZ|nr:Late embryogenesis abundant protein [Melia azedarach]
MMLSTKSESDITSLAPSSPSRSPKRPVYYVQSPSRDSHDGDKSSSMQPSPMESPSHPSFGRHSRNSSASRFSGIFRSSSGRKGTRKRNDKGWPECNVIVEEGKYDEFEDKAFTRRFQALMGILSFVVLFTVFCLIIWGASRPYKAEITVKSLLLHNFYIGEGSDSTGVPTKMVTVNSTLKINVYNPATIFGIHVSSSPINLVYSEIVVATGQLKKYYQPRKSHRTVSVILQGNKVPLYGAGSGLTVSQTGGEVPLTLKFGIRSRGEVVGKLVKTTHRKQISCSLVIDILSTKPIKFKKSSCTYE